MHNNLQGALLTMAWPSPCRLVRTPTTPRRRENMVGVNMVGVNMAFHDAICECFEGAMLEPCLLKPCFHVAGYVGRGHDTVGNPHRAQIVRFELFELVLLSKSGKHI